MCRRTIWPELTARWTVEIGFQSGVCFFCACKHGGYKTDKNEQIIVNVFYSLGLPVIIYLD